MSAEWGSGAGAGCAPETALAHLRARINKGAPWAEALLEAVGMWTAPQETVDGQELVYLIGGEAFDWLALTARLLDAVHGTVPEDEAAALLGNGHLPEAITPAAFKDALGPAKYRAHLNYFYGVVVEEALRAAVEEEVLKERGVQGLSYAQGVEDAVFERLYRAEQPALLRAYRREQGLSRSVRMSLAETKAFTYWCFKRRLNLLDAARVASDTRKGLRVLQEMHAHVPESASGAALPVPALV
ncbi:MAG: hypothetical protein VW450_00070 [Chloroflexota bacterium]